MGSENRSEPGLTREARSAVWRIFGAGAAPGTKLSTYEYVEPLIREYLPPADQDRAIAEIGRWFESGAQTRWLKADLGEMVAELVIEGVGPRRSPDAIWAIGSIGFELSATQIRQRWSSGEIDSFVAATVEALNATPDAVVGGGVAARSEAVSEEHWFRDAVLKDGVVNAFAHLEKESLELVNQGLHPSVGNLIDLAVELRPQELALFVERLADPAMQARAARRMVVRTSPTEQGAIARWFTSRSADAVVALAILHTLNAVARINEGRVLPGRREPQRSVAGDGLAREGDNADEAALTVLRELVDRLATLDPADCLRWIGELVIYAGRALSQPGEPEPPLLLAQLEEECTKRAAGVLFEFGSENLLLQFQRAPRPQWGRSWIRHQAAIARAMRDLSPERAAELARAILDEHRQLLAQPGGERYLAADWAERNGRGWVEGLGMTLALSRNELDLPDWVMTECRDLPLSVWDAEEDPDAFTAAEQMAQHWFLVALLAVPCRSELRQPIEPSAVRALAEAVWAHCGFCRQHVDSDPEGSVAAELAARYAVRFGQADDRWILDQARSEGVGARALWVLLEERRIRGHLPLEGSPDGYHEMIEKELVRIAADRFDDGGQFDLETLRFWGRLWLSLGAVDQAERTARAIVSFPLRAADRCYRILALKLLGMVARNREARYGITAYAAPLYSQLWPVLGGTPLEEREARREIDEAFGGTETLGR